MSSNLFCHKYENAYFLFFFILYYFLLFLLLKMGMQFYLIVGQTAFYGVTYIAFVFFFFCLCSLYPFLQGENYIYNCVLLCFYI